MKTPIPFYLQKILNSVREEDGGEVADYIPQLAQADPDQLGVALCSVTGHLYSAGDAENRFTIQSISKPFVYALALQELGLNEVCEVVGLEPSGQAFNELSLANDHRPVNPLFKGFRSLVYIVEMQIITDFVQSLRARGCRRETISLRRYHAMRAMEELGNPHTWTVKKVEAYLANPDWSPATRRSAHASLKAFVSTVDDIDGAGAPCPARGAATIRR